MICIPNKDNSILTKLHVLNSFCKPFIAITKRFHLIIPAEIRWLTQELTHPRTLSIKLIRIQ